MVDKTLGGGTSMPDERLDVVAELQKISNVGPVMTRGLIRLGVLRLKDLVGKDPDEMYHELCVTDGIRHDPCVRDVFAATVAYANGEPARPWWTFTPERKARDRHMREAR